MLRGIFLLLLYRSIVRILCQSKYGEKTTKTESQGNSPSLLIFDKFRGVTGTQPNDILKIIILLCDIHPHDKFILLYQTLQY